MTSLALSHNTTLTELTCIENQQLQCLNLKNGNNYNFNGSMIDLSNNPNLVCIEVDDAVLSITNQLILTLKHHSARTVTTIST